MSDLTKAIRVATSAHENQVDKGGKPYIEHPLRVMKQMTTDTARIVAVLHDVIEDSDYSLDDLVAAGFSKEVVEAVEALTKQKGEPYKKYLRRIKTNPIAIAVKLADLQDNMDLTRLPTITEKDIERQEKYFKAVDILKNNE
ncbi:HD domain-containing protein [Aliterella atlantica]|uniref:GTP pyrophosphokinase n=1 Tax=Aliterella atlantica CENA595 TaxID=1618023 RepID=A0A0D8ZST3_9CYAN|nr:HD domain-containing protein [Aliterella atlantica]KJH70281.1 GTP pyrophosphokinase [Aliterella atlantica CENA595]